MPYISSDVLKPLVQACLTPSYIEKINTCIENIDVFESDDLSFEENRLRRISFLVANPDIVQPIQLLVEHDIEIKVGFEAIVRACYFNQQDVLVEVYGEKSEEKLGVKSALFLSELSEKNKYIEVSENLSLSTWGNYDYVMEKINVSLINFDLTKLIGNFTHENLWTNKKFLKEALNTNISILNEIPRHLFKHLDVLDVMCEQEDFFNRAWAFEYKKLFFDKYINNQNPPTDHPDFYQILWNKITQSSSFIIDCMASMSDSRERNNFYNILPDEFKTNSEVVNEYIIQKSSDINMIPPHYFKSDNHIIEFFQWNIHRLPVARYFYDGWINNETKVLDYLFLVKDKRSNASAPAFAQKVSSLLSLEFKNSLSLSQMLVSLSPATFKDLNPLHQYDEKVLSSMASWARLKNFKKEVSAEIIYQIKNQELIVQWLYHRPELIENAPNFWKKTPGIVIGLGLEMKNYVKSGVIHQDIFHHALENSDLIEKLILNDPSEYLHLPEKFKKNPDVALIYIKANIMDMALDEIAQNVNFWASQSFCLKAMQISAMCALNVPKPFWRERRFLNEVASLIDKEKIDGSVFQAQSDAYMLFSNLGATVGNYQNLLNKYCLKIDLDQDLNDNNINQKVKNKI